MNSTTKLSLLCSLAGMALLYVGAIQMRPGLTPISKIDMDFVGLKTKVSGRVIDLSRHSKGHVFLKVKDGSGGVISVPIFASMSSKLDEEVKLLDNIRITGEVENYQGELELLPEGAESIKVIHSTPTEVSRIDEGRVGETVKIRGVVREKEPVGKGSLLMEIWGDDSGLTVYMPPDVAGARDLPEIGVGDRVQLAGLVQLYEGELELKLSSSYNIEVLGESR